MDKEINKETDKEFIRLNEYIKFIESYNNGSCINMDILEKCK